MKILMRLILILRIKRLTKMFQYIKIHINLAIDYLVKNILNISNSIANTF
jgi:hypothetical protein